MKLFLRAFFVLALLAATTAADVIVLKDGRRLRGKVLEKRRDVIVVETGVGRLELDRRDVVEIVPQRTPKEEFRQRFARVESADQAYDLGLWAREHKMRVNARKAFERALELDPQHEGAHHALGHVRYRGEWMTPEAAELRRAADLEAEMMAKGLVRYGDRWVTPEDKLRLEAGLVEFEGEWMTPDERRRRQGEELFEGRWMPAGEARAWSELREVEAVLGGPLEVVSNDQAIVAGELDPAFLQEVAGGLERARAWFDGLFGVPTGLELLGGRPAEVYCFGRDPEGYRNTVPLLIGRTPTIPDELAPTVARTHGFYWFFPYVLSSARLGQRDPVHLRGHCLHHWGHLLLNRLGYDGKLLPPWYDEGFASLTEFQTFERNYVFCHASGRSGGGSRARGSQREFDTQSFLNGSWQESLRDALAAGAVPRFDRLARLELSELELPDVAASMTILDWLSKTGGEGALRRFHDAVRAAQPASPARVEPDARVRLAGYERAFRAAAGMGWREADQAWREWFLERR